MKKHFVALAVVVAVVVCFISMAMAVDKVVYTVKRGDTLGELMYAWKVQGIEIEKLYSWNPSLGTQVKIGQEIVYYLPDRLSVNAQLSEQEIKKVVEDTISQVRAKEQGTSKANQVLSLLALCAGIALAVVSLVLLIVLLVRTRTGKVKTQSQAVGNKVTIELGENGLYETDIEFDPAIDRWLTPFCHINGGERMQEKSEGDAKRTVRKCWRQTEKYGEQINKLLAEKTIRQIDKKGLRPERGKGT